jgi:hypothetical protein
MGPSYTLPEPKCIKLAFSSSSKTSPSSSETSSLSLRTLPKDILLVIFVRLDVISITAVEITCKYFKSIWESVLEPEMDMDFIPQVNTVDLQYLCRFRYLSKCISQDLKLQSLSEFKLVVPEGKTESSLEYPMKALLVQDRNLGNDELQ